MFSETFITTIGIDFKIKYTTHRDQVYKVVWWDTAGQERFRSVTTSYIKGAYGILLVLDVTNANALVTMEHWIRDVVERCPYGTRFLLAANKIDSPARVVSRHDIEAFCARMKIPFVEVSAKTGERVDEAFETLAGLVADNLAPAIAKYTIYADAKYVELRQKRECCQ